MTQNITDNDYPTSDGEILIGSTGNRPVPNTLTAGANVTIVDGPGTITISTTAGTGDVVQQVNVVDKVYSTHSGNIPVDDTIPQISEGAEILSLSITPTSASNVLIFDYNVTLASGGHLTFALFQNPTADAIYATSFDAPSNLMYTPSFKYLQVAGTTSPTTFSIRAGRPPPLTAIFAINGIDLGRRYGGVAAQVLTITEVLP